MGCAAFRNDYFSSYKSLSIETLSFDITTTCGVHHIFCVCPAWASGIKDAKLFQRHLCGKPLAINGREISVYPASPPPVRRGGAGERHWLVTCQPSTHDWYFIVYCTSIL